MIEGFYAVTVEERLFMVDCYEPLGVRIIISSEATESRTLLRSTSNSRRRMANEYNNNMKSLSSVIDVTLSP